MCYKDRALRDRCAAGLRDNQKLVGTEGLKSPRGMSPRKKKVNVFDCIIKKMSALSEFGVKRQ